MVDAFEHFELSARLAQTGGPGFGAGCRRHGVDAHATLNSVNADMAGLPILVTVAFSGQLHQLVVTHLAVFVGRPNTRLKNGPANGTRLHGIHRHYGVRGDTVAECAHDTRIVQRTRAPMLESGRFGQPLQLACQAGRGQKNGRLDKWQPHLRLHDGRLAPQQAGQALGLAVGKNQRVVVSGAAAIRGPRPAVCIATQHARAAFDFNQKEACWRQHQGVHLVDLAFIVNELEIGPDVPGVAVRQMGSQPFKRFALPGKVGLGNDVPTRCAQRHEVLLSASGTCSNKSPTEQRNRLQSASMAATSTRVTVSLYRDVTVLRFKPVRRETSEIRSLSRPIRVERWQRIMANLKDGVLRRITKSQFAHNPNRMHGAQLPELRVVGTRKVCVHADARSLKR